MSEYCLLLRKDLRKPLPAARWPEGFSLVTLSEALMPSNCMPCFARGTQTTGVASNLYSNTTC